MSKTAKNWISAIEKLSWAKDYFEFLNTKLVSLPQSRQEDLINRIVSPDDDAFWGVNGELVYCGFWDYLKWPFEKDPSLNGKNPDFKVYIDKKTKLEFISDVTVVTHNYPHIEKRFDVNPETGSLVIIEGGREVSKLTKLTEPIDQAHRFRMKIAEKFEKYESLIISNQIPLVVCCIINLFDDNFYLDDFQLRNALFGDLKINFSSGKVWHDPNKKTAKRGKEVECGLFAFDRFESLAAVVVCRQQFSNTAEFRFSIYSNPLGKWGSRQVNPFSPLGLPVNGLLINNVEIELHDPVLIKLY